MPPLLDFLKTDDIPPIARRNYAVELRHAAAWGVCMGVIEGNTSSIVVAKTFHGSDFLVSFVWATPMLANILSLAWSAAARGRRKLFMTVVLSLGAIASLASVGWTPSGEGSSGGWLFALQIGLSRLFLAGVVTLRASIWETNYPATHRGRITGRIQKLRAGMGLIATASITAIFDRHADYYRFVYPAVGVVGLLSLWFQRRLRIRGERRELAQFSRLLASPDGDAARRRFGFWGGLRESISIIRRDHDFARYCRAQYFLGSANFMLDPIVLYVVDQRLKLGYFVSSSILDIVPAIVMLFTINFTAAQYDRVGLLRFRVSNSFIWLLSIGGASIAMTCVELGGTPGLWVGIGLLYAARILNGVGRAGGSIAWNLGHLNYAEPSNSDLYMGIHQVLTGIRGLIMPFVGRYAYRYFGWSSLLLAVGLALAAWMSFRALANEARRPAKGSDGDEQPPRSSSSPPTPIRADT